MFMLTQLNGFNAVSETETLLQILTRLSLTTNLKACLDLGDAASYDGTGQNLVDRAGVQDWYRGATSGSEASDWTFNGVSGGLSVNEYASHDGGDFSIVQAQPAYANEFHKDSANLSFLMGLRLPAAAATEYMFATANGTNTDTGVEWFLASGNFTPQFSVRDGSGSPALNVVADSTLTADAIHIIGLSINEAGGAVSFFWQDGSYNQVSASDTFDAAYATPSAGNASQTLRMGDLGGGGGPFSNGVRLYFAAIWQGTALTKANFDSIWTAIRGRLLI